MKNNLKKFLVATVATLGFVAVAHTEVSADTITVQSGDTLWELANTYGTSIDTIQKDNNLANANLIITGDKLIVNPSSSEQATISKPVVSTPAAETQTTAPVAVTETPVETVVVSSSAKEQLAQRESGGSYTATNGQYYGRYQLSLDKLGGDLSVANQERAADAYVSSRYGSWENALAHSNATGWY